MGSNNSIPADPHTWMCMCAPSRSEYVNELCLILQQSLPIAKPLINIVYEYVQLESPLRAVMRIYSQTPSYTHYLYDNRAKITRMLICPWYDEPLMDPLFHVATATGYMVSIRIQTNHRDAISKIGGCLKSRAYRVKIRDDFVYASMPFECKCDKWQEI